MLVADGFASGRQNQSAQVVGRQTVELIRAGVRFVWLRDLGAKSSLCTQAARMILSELGNDEKGDLILVTSSRPVAQELNCQIHVSALSSVRFDSPDLGFSAHSVEDVVMVERGSFTYSTLSPIYPTATHPETRPLGLEYLAEACSVVPDFPVLALGGITPERAKQCVDVGAHGVAVLSDLLDSDDPVQRVQLYKEALSG